MNHTEVLTNQQCGYIDEKNNPFQLRAVKPKPYKLKQLIRAVLKTKTEKPVVFLFGF